MAVGSTTDTQGSSDAGNASELFEAFAVSNTCHGILSAFERLCDVLDLNPSRPGFFYDTLKAKLRNWKAEALWNKLDKRAGHKDYKNNAACSNTRVLVIGAGPCGLRAAIECKLLGAKCVVVEKRDSFSRNNVLHLWPFVIHDLKSLGAKMFFPKFCAGAIDHISIRQLQCVLLKIALIFGVEVHVRVGFEGLLEPDPTAPLHSAGSGWHAQVSPGDHVVSQYDFDVLIGADGKRNTLNGFPRKEFRGKLAIAITANFINHRTQQENRVEEISGVAFIFNQKFFKDLYAKTGIDLENIVYYKDDTHYFVMTAKKHSLLQKGVILEDNADVVGLLAKDNINQQALLDYAREAADVSTDNMLPSLEFAHNGYGQADVAMFDFTSIFAAENASRVVERNGLRLLMGIVGDSLLEPFWPTGSGCARGFLGALDAAWMVRSWASGTMTPLEVVAERESVYQLLSQTTSENLNKNAAEHSIHPQSRYPKCNMHRFKPSQVRHLYDAPADVDVKVEEQSIVSGAPPAKHPRAYDVMADSDRLLRWYQKQLAECHVPVVITDLTLSWQNGTALCAILHKYLPDAVEPLPVARVTGTSAAADVLPKVRHAINAAHIHLGITPLISAEDLLYCGERGPDRLSMLSYLSSLYEVLRSLRRATLALSPLHHKKAEILAVATKEAKDSSSMPPPPPQAHKGSRISRLFKGSKVSLGRRRASRAAGGTGIRHGSPAEKTSGGKASMLSFKGIGVKALKEGISIFENQGGVELQKASHLTAADIRSVEVAQNAEKGNLVAASASSRSATKVSQITNRYEEVDAQAKAACTPPVARKVIVRDLTGSSQSSAGLWNSSDMCSLCGKRVYLVERQSAEGCFFHRSCFRCTYCNVALRVGGYLYERNFMDGSGKFFCSYQHLDLQKQGLSARKRSYADADKQDAAEKSAPVPPLSSQVSEVDGLSAVVSKATDRTAVAHSDVQRRTLERAEFENSAEHEEEECEESQTSHNFSTLSALDADESRWEPSDEDDEEDANDGCSSSSTSDTDASSSFEEEDAKAEMEADTYEEGNQNVDSVDASFCEEDEDCLNTSEDVQTVEKGRLGTTAYGGDTGIVSHSEQTSAGAYLTSQRTPSTSAASDVAGSSRVSEADTRPMTRQSSSLSDVLRRRSNFFAEAPEPVRLDHRIVFAVTPQAVVPEFASEVSESPQQSCSDATVSETISDVLRPAAVDERFVTKRNTSAGCGTATSRERRHSGLYLPRTESESSFSISPSSSDDEGIILPPETPPAVPVQLPEGDTGHAEQAVLSHVIRDTGSRLTMSHVTSDGHFVPSNCNVTGQKVGASTGEASGNTTQTSISALQKHGRRRIAMRRSELTKDLVGSRSAPHTDHSSKLNVSGSSSKNRKRLVPDMPLPSLMAKDQPLVPGSYHVFGSSHDNTGNATSANAEAKNTVLAGRFREMCLQPAVPTASAEEFSDDEDAEEEEKSATMHNQKILRAAQRQQRQLEMKRLHMAQEIQRHLQEVEVQQKELEERGIAIERALRGESADSEVNEVELMKDWFSLVHQKNMLLRYESELLIQARQLELEDRQSRLEVQLRSRMLQHQHHSEKPDKKAAAVEHDVYDALDKSILDELIEVVEQRDQLVQSLEADRLREREEDAILQEVMLRKGFKELSPSPYTHSVRRQQQQRRRSGTRTPRLACRASAAAWKRGSLCQAAGDCGTQALSALAPLSLSVRWEVTAWTNVGMRAVTQIDTLCATVAIMVAVAFSACTLVVTKLCQEYI